MFEFIYDETGGLYHLWWDSFPEAKLGSLRQLCMNEWECVPGWQAHLRLDLQYCLIHADSKEAAALLWLTKDCGVDGVGCFDEGEEDDD